MTMFRNIALALAVAAPAVQAGGSSLPNCKTVSMTATGSAINKNLTNFPDLSKPDEVLSALNDDTFGAIPVSGSQTIVGRYCEPSVKNANANRLQFLSHGITSNKDYWSGLGFPGYQGNKYSWIAYAADQGYPTLSIDRLGNGQSSHPDPVLVVQGPYEYALYHDLVGQIKAGKTGVLPRSFSDITYVGHSYGSEIGDNMAHLFPDDFKTLILTGFSKSVDPSLPGVSAQIPVPAAVHDPARFGGLAPGFVTSSYKTGRLNSFFGTTPGKAYDPAIGDLFYTTEDTVSIGQFVSTYDGITGAPEYKGRVLVLTGENDQAFCGPGSPVFGPAMCGSLLPDTKSLFPNAEYSWHSVPDTGHVVNLHYSGPGAFVVAHNFLAGQTYSG